MTIAAIIAIKAAASINPEVISITDKTFKGVVVASAEIVSNGLSYRNQ